MAAVHLKISSHMDPILLRTLLFCHKYKTKLPLNSKNVKQLITTATISIEVFLSRECGWYWINTHKMALKTTSVTRALFHAPLLTRLILKSIFSSLRKQPTFYDATTCFPAKWCWGMSIKCPYWRPITTQIRVVLLIGWKFASSNQKQYPDLQGCH